MACLHRGILFLTGLKLKNEVFTVAEKGPKSNIIDESKQKSPFEDIEMFHASETDGTIVKSIFDRHKWFGNI